VTFDVFDDLVSQEFYAPERNARHAAALHQAFSEVNRLFGDFLRQAADDDEFSSRWSLVAADMQPIWNRFGLTTADQKTVGGRLKVSDSWQNPDHKSDKCTTTEDAANPATSVPWDEAGPTPPQSGDEEFNDATLHHVASWFKNDPVTGLDPGDSVAITNDAYDSMTGQPISGGESGTVVDINGGDVTVDVNGSDVVLPVQNLDRLGSTRQGLAPLVAPLLRTVVPMAVDAIGDWASSDSSEPSDSAASSFGEGALDIAGGIGQGASDLLMGDPIKGINDVGEGFSNAFGGDDAPSADSGAAPPPDPNAMAEQTRKMELNPSGMGKDPGIMADDPSMTANDPGIMADDPSMTSGLSDGASGVADQMGRQKNKDAMVSHSRIANGWAWDSDSNAYKSAGKSVFSCACGQQFQGVGQHRCLCGKVWNMSSIINGSKTAQEYPVYSCREVETDPRLVLADAQNNGTGNDPAKGGAGANDDPPQPDLVMEPDKDSYVDPAYGKGAKVARMLVADAGLWPLLEDKDIMANWKSLLSIILNPAQVSALEHEQYQGLIQDLYNEICRRGLDSPVDPEQMQQGLVNPGQQLMNPSPTALAYRRMGYNAALAGVSPALDEPVECLQGYVLGLNKKMAESYEDRTTIYDGSEPATPGNPVNSDSLDSGQNIADPTPSQRSDFAGDTDARNTEGQSDDDAASHPGDFEPQGQKTTQHHRAWSFDDDDKEDPDDKYEVNQPPGDPREAFTLWSTLV